MERDDREPSARFQIFLRRVEHRRKLAQLVVHGNADGLKATLGRVLLFAQRARGHGRTDDIGELKRRFDGLLLAVLANSLRDGGRIALLAVFKEDAAQLFIRIGIHDLARGQCGGFVHAHIERRVLLVGKPALRFVELRGGNAEVKKHPVHAVDAQLVQHSVERAEIAVDERDLVQIIAEAAVCRFDRGLVTVKRNEAARRQAAHDLERMSGAPERTVHIDAVGLDGERAEALVQQYRLMAVVLFHIRIPALPSRRPDSRD